MEFLLDRAPPRLDSKKVESRRGVDLGFAILFSIFVLVVLTRFIVDVNLLLSPPGPG